MLHPFLAGPFTLRMGLHQLALDDWIDGDDEFDSHLALKRELLASRRDDVVALVDEPSVLAACTELEEAIVTWWADRAGAPASPDPALHPIIRASLRTQEDWCLLGGPSDSVPVLVAGSVCFPTRWILREKVGRSISAIHGPVAFYDAQLATPVDRFLSRLRADAPVWRANWNLVDDAALCQSYLPEPGRKLECTVAEVPDLVQLRVERQTLRRLPRSGAIAFGIRVHQQPLRALEAEPEVLGRLHGAIRALPPETFAYKGLGAFWSELDTWLSAVAAEPASNGAD